MILKGTSPSRIRRGDCFTATVISFNLILMVVSLCLLMSYTVLLVRGKQYIDLLGGGAAWIVAFLVILLSSLMIIAVVCGIAGVAGANIAALKCNCVIFLFLVICVFLGGIVAWHEMWNIINLVSYNLKRNMGLYNPSSTSDATTVWDDIQRNMKCCGIDRPSDWGKYCPSYKYTIAHKYPPSCEGIYVYGDGCLAKLTELIRMDLWTVGACIATFTVYGVVTMAMTGLLVKRLQGDKREYYTHEDSPKVNDTQGGVAAGELHPKAREALEGVSSSEEPESSSATAATLPADIAERGPRDAAGTGGSKTSLGGEQAEAGAGGPGHHRPASPMRHVKRIGAAVAKGVRSCWAHICG